MVAGGKEKVRGSFWIEMDANLVVA